MGLSSFLSGRDGGFYILQNLHSVNQNPVITAAGSTFIEPAAVIDRGRFLTPRGREHGRRILGVTGRGSTCRRRSIRSLKVQELDIILVRVFPSDLFNRYATCRRVHQLSTGVPRQAPGSLSSRRTLGVLRRIQFSERGRQNVVHGSHGVVPHDSAIDNRRKPTVRVPLILPKFAKWASLESDS